MEYFFQWPFGSKGHYHFPSGISAVLIDFLARNKIAKRENFVLVHDSWNVQSKYTDYEAISNLTGLKKYKIKTGIIVKVNEKPEDFEDLIYKVDKITFMGTELGVKGKNFDKKVLVKISNLKKYLTKINKSYVLIEVDGGIRKENVVDIIMAGANSIVAGSLIFNKEYKKISKWLHSL